MFSSDRQKFIENERKNIGTLDQKDIEAALLQLSSEPIHTYLLSLIDELVRQGIYLSKEEQEGAKIFIKLIGDEMQRGMELRKKQDRVKRNKK
jgi:hypothetical protein